MGKDQEGLLMEAGAVKIEIEDTHNTVCMKLVDEKKNVRKEVRITTIIANYSNIDVSNTKIRVYAKNRLLVMLEEIGKVVWLRYFKFKDDEVFKEFLRRLGL